VLQRYNKKTRYARTTQEKIAKNTKKMQKNLVMSEKSSNFAGYFAERPD
jgi:hypothetical protein